MIPSSLCAPPRCSRQMMDYEMDKEYKTVATREKAIKAGHARVIRKHTGKNLATIRPVAPRAVWDRGFVIVSKRDC